MKEETKKQLEINKQKKGGLLGELPKVDTKKLLKSSDKSNILRTTKEKRTIEPSTTFGYSLPTEDVSIL